MAGLHAFQLGLDAQVGQNITLSPEESRHLVKSLRARAGEDVAVFNGQGSIFFGVVEEADGKAACVKIKHIETRPPRSPRLILAPALLKGKAIEEMLRDVVTLGLSQLIALAAKRSEVRLDGERAATRTEKWTLGAIEACKQSGNPWLPQISPVHTLPQFSQTLRNLEAQGPLWKFVASLEPDARPFAEVLLQMKQSAPAPQAMLLMVGPEGDFTPEEYAQARADKFIPVRLPGYIFRAGPAALVGLSLMAGIF